MIKPKLARKSDVSAEQLLEGQRLLLSLSGTLSNPHNSEFEKNLLDALEKIARHFQVEDCLLWIKDGNSYSSKTGAQVSDEYRSLLKTASSGLTCESPVAWFNSNLLVGIRAGAEIVGVFCIHCHNEDASQFPTYYLDLLQIASDMFSGFLLRASEQMTHKELDLRFRTVLDNLQEGITIGDLDDRLLYVNHRYAEMVGYAPEELIGKRGYRFLVPTEEHSKIKEGTSRRVAGSADAYECTQITKSGKRIITIINACPYRNVRGQVIGNISSHTDITARRETELENERLQKQLNRSQRMEAVGQLAAGFAHDLSNSLTAITAHLNLIKYKNELSSDETRDGLNAALAGCQNATELLRNVLTFSADSPVQAKVDELRKAIDEAIDLTKSVLPKNTSVRISSQSQEYPVEIDRSLIVQALTNLIINASQSMQKGGTISFSLSSTDIDIVDHLNRQARPGRYWVLTISDTGCGIPEDMQHRVFEPFFSTKGENSSGLGLSMVYTTMQRHGGWIEVDSTVGAGSAFSLYFPSPEEPANLSIEKEVVASSNTAGGRENGAPSCGYIVVIDDEPVLAELACSFLERAGFRTKNFSNPLEAFDWYSAHHAETSLILLDMKMPECDGVAAFEKLKSINPLAQIVLISGYVDDENVSHLLSRGAVSFIQKPVKYSELVEWVKKTIRVTGQSGPEAVFH